MIDEPIPDHPDDSRKPKTLREAGSIPPDVQKGIREREVQRRRERFVLNQDKLDDGNPLR